MVKANVDIILDLLREKKTVSENDIISKLKLPKEDIQKSLDYLEEDGVVKIQHKFPHMMVTLIKDPDEASKETPDVSEMEGDKEDTPPDSSSFDEQYAPKTVPDKKTPEKPGQPSAQQGVSTQILKPSPEIGISTGQEPKQKDGLITTGHETNEETEDFQFQLAEQGEQNIPPPQTPGHNQGQSQMNLFVSPTMVSEGSGGNVPQKSIPSDGIETVKSTRESAFEPMPGPIETRPEEVPDVNPLNEDSFGFELNAPSPGGKEEKEQKKPKPVLAYSDKYSKKKDYSFPKQVQNDVEKIDYLITMANQKITEHDYKDLNVLYRNIYEMYTKVDLSPNERYIVGDKLNELFDRVKGIYLIEGTAI
ncbi:hypothetical protein JXC34_00240, partial [Candidatus Woesearchaeota archaeon]|nr:hypothetical protein [Candidatus Woesearchaeota archaeon]